MWPELNVFPLPIFFFYVSEKENDSFFDLPERVSFEIKVDVVLIKLREM